MLSWLLLGFVAVVMCFGFVLLFGAPYLPTLRPQSRTALDLIALKPGQHLLELGCGDGRVLRAAAERGLQATGYELNPLLALTARLVTWRYRRQVRVVWGNFWRRPWPEADAVFVFLLDPFMARLDRRLQAIRPIKLVSFAFEIPGRTADRQSNGIFFYDYR